MVEIEKISHKPRLSFCEDFLRTALIEVLIFDFFLQRSDLTRTEICVS